MWFTKSKNIKSYRAKKYKYFAKKTILKPSGIIYSRKNLCMGHVRCATLLRNIDSNPNSKKFLVFPMAREALFIYQ